MMGQSIEELANYIVNEIEREDFIYALQHYGCYIGILLLSLEP